MGEDIRKVTGTNRQYRKFPMPRFIILGIAILLLFLPWFSPYNAMAFTVKEGGATQKGAASASKATSKTAQAKIAPRPSPSVQREIVNIVVDRIEDGAMYAKDGRKFEITSSTRVINNTHPVTRMRTAELTFENGTLVAVILK